MSLRDRLAGVGLRDRVARLRLGDRVARLPLGDRPSRLSRAPGDRALDAPPDAQPGDGPAVPDAPPRDRPALLRAPRRDRARAAPRAGEPARGSARAVDRAWPALPLAALGVAALVAVVGVVAAPQPSETARIVGTVHDFAAAVQEKRGEDACALLTPAGRQAVTAQVGTLGCAATIRSFGYGIDPGVLRVARVTGGQIAGDRATIPRAQLLAPGGRPVGRTITLERIGGEWRIAAVT